MLPKAFKNWPKSNKLPNLVTLESGHIIARGILKFERLISGKTRGASRRTSCHYFLLELRLIFLAANLTKTLLLACTMIIVTKDETIKTMNKSKTGHLCQKTTLKNWPFPVSRISFSTFTINIYYSSYNPAAPGSNPKHSIYAFSFCN